MRFIVCMLFVSFFLWADKPNILFIAVDDLRTELNCYGDTQVKTPHIDKLAADAIVFERAYCNIPVCGASRSSLMSGIYPTPKRYITYTSQVQEDTPGAKTLPQVFRENGYTALSRGKIFHNPKDSAKASWDEPAWKPKVGGLTWFDTETGKALSKKKRGRIYELPDVADNAYPDGQVAEKVIDDLRKFKESGKPFFLACGFIKPHMPFYAPKRYWDMYDRNAIKLADNQYMPKNAPKSLKGSGEFRSYHLENMDPNSEKFHRVMKHGYLACVSYIDKLVGDVLNELQKLELDKNTIVVFWGDHGWHLGEHNFWGKHNTMHHSTQVPLIVKVPGTKGAKSSALVETVDIFPTLCELADLKIPSQVQGLSFTKVLKNPQEKFRDYIYSRFGPGDAIVSKNFSFTRYKDKTIMLYDHRKDPQENVNVAGNPEYESVIKLMQKQLDDAMAKAKAAKW
ncbi:MAG: sulfatase [Lentisphaeraceae bacterium]|nr:sulfatase [Lentisphaeraceae bacterium]